MLFGRQTPISDPRLGSQCVCVRWLEAAAVPNPCLPLVETDVGMCLQVVSQQVVHWADSMWLYNSIDIIQESIQGFTWQEVFLYSLEGWLLA